MELSGGRSELSPEIRSALSPYFRSARYFRSEMLWHEGDTEGMLVSLVEGRVKIFRVTADGRSVTLFIMRPGNIFGFLPLVDGGPYPVSAEAIEDVNALVITHAQFVEALDENPRVALPLLSHLSGHLRSAFNLITRISSRDALPRVASALQGLMEEGEARPEPGRIILPASSREYASLLGLAPESFSRKITELVDMGVIERDGVNRFRVIDAERLSSLAVPGIFI